LGGESVGKEEEKARVEKKRKRMMVRGGTRDINVPMEIQGSYPDN